MMTIDGTNYLTRKDLQEMGWEQAEIQALTPDRKMPAKGDGRGRPSYLYRESKVMEGKPTVVPKVEPKPVKKGFKVFMVPHMAAPESIMDEVNANDDKFVAALKDVGEGKADTHIEVDANGRQEMVVCSKPSPIVEPKPEFIPPSSFHGPKPQGLCQAVIVGLDGSETSVTLTKE